MKKSIFLLLIVCLLIGMAVSIPAVAKDESDYTISDEGRLPFEDVKENHWFYEAAEFCYANGIINGMNEYTFGWSGNLTRAQFVLMLANLEGVDTSTYTVDKFTDVKSGHWFYGAVAWAYENGIVSGMTETTFVPNGVLTRAQLAVVMNNYMKDKYTVEINDGVFDRFTDKPKEEYWYYDAMKFAVSAGLLSGNSDGTLVATGNVTRAQAAVIFKNFSDNYYYASCEHSFTEADCTNAPVCEKCGLVNGLPNGHTVDASYSCKLGGKCSVCSVTVEKSNILHDFAAANCGNPRICKRCNIKRGEPVGNHNWWAATCTNPKMCKVCYKTEGNNLGHNYTDPTCTERPKCRRCGVVNGASLGHSFSDATCTKARVCKRCGIESGQPLGHNMVNNVCKRCKYTNITNSFDKAVYYLKKDGYNSVSNGKIVGQGRWGAGEALSSNEHLLCNVEYRYAENHIEFSSMYTRSNGENIVFYIYVPKVSGSYKYWIAYYDTNGNVVASAYGNINPGSVYDGMSFIPANYSGRNSLKSDFNYYAKHIIVRTVRGCDEILNEYCDCDIKDFGFKYF